MSLKAFHIIFITASMILTVGFGVWALNQFFNDGRSRSDLVGACLSFGLSIGLVFYGKYFLKKLKHVDYL